MRRRNGDDFGSHAIQPDTVPATAMRNKRERVHERSDKTWIQVQMPDNKYNRRRQKASPDYAEIRPVNNRCSNCLRYASASISRTRTHDEKVASASLIATEKKKNYDTVR
jgi:hypothetical protein